MERRLRAVAVVLALVVGTSSRAFANGAQLERFEPAAAGSWFFGVDHPWYSSTRWLAAGLTLDYGHDPLLGGTFPTSGGFVPAAAVVAHELVGHVDVAGSLFDRVQVAATLPVVFAQRGTPAFGVEPAGGVVVGDPRVGALARIYGQPERDRFSLHAGAKLWIPVGASGSLAGDAGVRGMPEVVVAGRFIKHLRYAVSAGVLIRRNTTIGFGPASSVGSELQLRAAVGWGSERYNVGPEASFSTAVSGDNAFARHGTSLELLVGGQYNFVRQVQVGAALGFGALPELGTPDVRAIVRLAWAPRRDPRTVDADRDGVPDAEDVCPTEAAGRLPDPRRPGCAARDVDHDGVPDAEDTCPDLPTGAHPDSVARGCPTRDSDSDGVPDAEDLCPDSIPGEHPDAAKKGCPVKDADSDGVPDAEDLCPDQKPGARPDPGSKGCPMKDSDGDGIPDVEDRCPNAALGANPDPKRRGCPLPDADGDGIPDVADACPKLAGPKSEDRKRSGCPTLEAKSGALTELRTILFTRNEAVLLPESFPVLDELAALLKQHREAKRVLIEGHADDTGTAQWNLRLSRHRAESVVRYLVQKGVAAYRLSAVGYGDTRPLSADRSEAAHARNRRVEMRVP